MRALLTQAAELLRGQKEDTLLCLTAPFCASPNIAAYASLLSSESTCVFAPPLRCDGFASVGIGEVLHVVGRGTAALTQAKEAAMQTLLGLRELAAPGCEQAPRPRLFGGLRFAADHSAYPLGDPWASFPDACFVLPRWTVFSRRDEAFLQLVLRPRDLGNLQDLETQLAALLSAHSAPLHKTLAGTDGLVTVRDVPNKSDYCKLVDAALVQIATGSLQKVVPARRKEIEASADFDPVQILGIINNSYSDCCRFLLSQREAYFLGATPELLCEKRGSQVRTEALAGTRARSASLDDEVLKRSLLGDDKERREHAIVIDAIVQSLSAHGCAPPQVTETGVRTLRTLHHLCTEIALTLSSPIHVLDLVSLLHPTPAVCGLPRAAAAQFLSKNEPVSRGMYAAPVGWFDVSGDGAFWVAIRSVLLQQRSAWLYAGAGVVSGSVAEREFEETSAKLAAMLTALGVST